MWFLEVFIYQYYTAILINIARMAIVENDTFQIYVPPLFYPEIFSIACSFYDSPKSLRTHCAQWIIQRRKER